MGVPYPDEMEPVLARHPVQLYESLLLVYLFMFLIEWRRERVTFIGEISLLYLLLASSIRFLMEYFRWGVSAKVMFGVITQAQVMCVLVIFLTFLKMKRLSFVSLKMGM